MTAAVGVASERPDASAVCARLAAVVGEGFVAPAGPGDAADGATTLCVARPADAAEVAALIRECGLAGLAIVPSGLGRHLDVGGAPRRCDVLLRLDRLAAILDHHAADMTVTVQAGCPLATLQAALARHGQHLPVDPPAPASTTVGGMLAAHLAGPLRASQGTARDLLLGIEVVDASGAIIRGGGRVVKNVAGYDLPRLHVGALGSLGAIVSATFKLRPRPAVERAVAIACGGPEEAAELALAVRDELDPHWLEIAVAAPGDPAPPAPGQWLVAAGAAGILAEVEDAVQRIARVAGVRRHRTRVIEDGAALRDRLGAAAIAPAAAVLRASTLPTGVGKALRALADAAAIHGLAPAIAAHAANGVVRAHLSDPSAVAPIVRRLRPPLEAAGGHLVVERAAPGVKQMLVGDADPWGDPGEAARLVRGIKSALDPDGLLSPGRLPGGV